MTNTNPHLERAIDRLVASGMTFSEVVRALASAQARNVVLEAALEMFADEDNWEYFQDHWGWAFDDDPAVEAQAALAK